MALLHAILFMAACRTYFFIGYTPVLSKILLEFFFLRRRVSVPYVICLPPSVPSGLVLNVHALKVSCFFNQGQALKSHNLF